MYVLATPKTSKRDRLERNGANYSTFVTKLQACQTCSDENQVTMHYAAMFCLVGHGREKENRRTEENGL